MDNYGKFNKGTHNSCKVCAYFWISGFRAAKTAHMNQMATWGGMIYKPFPVLSFALYYMKLISADLFFI
jgi:hypothetical protein